MDIGLLKRETERSEKSLLKKQSTFMLSKRYVNYS